MLSGQVVDVPATVPVVPADTLEVTIPLLKNVRGTPVPSINGPKDIKLDRDASLRYLESRYGRRVMTRCARQSGISYGLHQGLRPTR